jgi:hypothetical protein
VVGQSVEVNVDAPTGLRVIATVILTATAVVTNAVAIDHVAVADEDQRARLDGIVGRRVRTVVVTEHERVPAHVLQESLDRHTTCPCDIPNRDHLYPRSPFVHITMVAHDHHLPYLQDKYASGAAMKSLVTSKFEYTTTRRTTVADREPREVVHDLVAGVVPLDEHEAQDKASTLEWVRSGAPLFRITRPATPDKHLCVYFALFDAARRSVLLVDHVKARLRLFPGGHVDDGEDPRTTVLREAAERNYTSPASFTRSSGTSRCS